MESLSGLLILNVTFKESNEYSPASTSVNTVAETFKICIREHNAHAQVNAGFNYDIVQDHLYRYFLFGDPLNSLVLVDHFANRPVLFSVESQRKLLSHIGLNLF
jgi:hypothetical protein